jgi:hypothetical protein
MNENLFESRRVLDFSHIIFMLAVHYCKQIIGWRCGRTGWFQPLSVSAKTLLCQQMNSGS